MPGSSAKARRIGTTPTIPAGRSVIGNFSGKAPTQCGLTRIGPFVPSLMVNGNGDMLMGFSGSSVNNYISAFYSWRLASGSVLAQPGLIRSGSKNYDSFLWGDYSATKLDPADDLSLWTVQAYSDGPQTRSAPWATAMGKIHPHP